ncbi:MAG: DnaD domain protein [Clostridia bacterium]|nr:DnaD domain protein [Clostridia bacterium]
MYFESFKSILYQDTLLPDIFISEYLPSMEGDVVKVYVYCLFLEKYNKQATVEELSKKLEMDGEKVKNSITYLECLGVLTRKGDNIILTDLKEKEINKIYRMKLSSTPEEAALSLERNKKRSSTITAINNMFFQGVMSPSWYTDIDAWFDRYKFDEDVMYALFQHCYDHKGLAKNYIAKVAENWYSKNIKNHFDMEMYLEEYQKFKDIRGKIIKKLKLSRNLTEYEDDYVEKWVMEFKYDFEVIELALKKTTAKTNPNLKYVDAIISDWHKNGLKTKEEILAYAKPVNKTVNSIKVKEASVPQHENYKQREYDNDYLNSFFENVVTK